MTSRDGHDAPVVAADGEVGAAHRSWEFPGAVDVAVAGDDLWVLLKTVHGYSVGTFDERTGNVRDPRPVPGSFLSMTTSGKDVWLWGESRSAAVQAALDSGSKALPTTGRTGIVHRLRTGRPDRTWELGATVPILLVADADRAWAYAADGATFMVPSLVYLGGRRDGSIDQLSENGGAYSFVLDGERLWLDDLGALLTIDRETGEIIKRREPARLRGRTADGRLWADVGVVQPFRIRAIDDGTVLHATGNVATVAGGTRRRAP
jgi:hypothetical protein